jgi:ankyrin repeat protein
MGQTHEMYNELYRKSVENKFDKTELYKLITPQNMNAQDDNGMTLFHLAAARSDEELIDFLLRQNADIRIQEMKSIN